MGMAEADPAFIQSTEHRPDPAISHLLVVETHQPWGMAEVDPGFILPTEHRPDPAISPAAGVPLMYLSSLLIHQLPSGPAQNTPNDFSALVSEIGEACRDWGFFQAVNHGVPAKLLESAKAAVRDFFALPAEEKGRVRRDEANPFSGYCDAELAKNVRDQKEAFDLMVREPGDLGVDLRRGLPWFGHGEEPVAGVPARDEVRGSLDHHWIPGCGRFTNTTL